MSIARKSKKVPHENVSCTTVVPIRSVAITCSDFVFSRHFFFFAKFFYKLRFWNFYDVTGIFKQYTLKAVDETAAWMAGKQNWGFRLIVSTLNNTLIEKTKAFLSLFYSDWLLGKKLTWVSREGRIVYFSYTAQHKSLETAWPADIIYSEDPHLFTLRNASFRSAQRKLSVCVIKTERFVLCPCLIWELQKKKNLYVYRYAVSWKSRAVCTYTTIFVSCLQA